MKLMHNKDKVWVKEVINTKINLLTLIKQAAHYATLFFFILIAKLGRLREIKLNPEI